MDRKGRFLKESLSNVDGAMKLATDIIAEEKARHSYPKDCGTTVTVERDPFSDLKSGEEYKGGEINMAEITEEYFEDQGRRALQALAEDPEDYDRDEIIEHGIGLELWLAENGEREEVDEMGLVGFATDEGYLDGMVAAKSHYQDQLDVDGLYDDLIEDTEERANIAAGGRVVIRQLRDYAERMSDGTRRVAEAHQRTQPVYDDAEQALEEGFDTVDTLVDDLLEARESKGLESDRDPEDLKQEVVIRRVLEKSVPEAKEDLERLSEELDLDIDRVREIEQEGKDRVTMYSELNSLE